ncbi:MAG: PfkB family carbohydrate kinase, partial [Chloroflexales bacterium]
MLNAECTEFGHSTFNIQHSMHTLADLVPLLASKRILVVGDVSLDEYLFGRATRLSREAPVPVLELIRREIILGGAANPARNVVALGSSADQVGIVGSDPEGQQLRDLLRSAGIDARGLAISPGRPTTLKTRVLAEESPRLPQQVARLDRLERAALSPAEEDL